MSAFADSATQPPAAPAAPLSLAAIVAAHGSVLVLDPCTIHVQAGVLRSGRSPLWHSGGDDSSIHLFAAAAHCLRAADLTPGRVGAYVFCEGPGSQLGIRTAAMSLRTWQALRPAPAPVFAYRSLLVAALAHARHQPGPFAVVADARRDSWHAVRVAADGTSPAPRSPSGPSRCSLPPVSALGRNHPVPPTPATTIAPRCSPNSASCRCCTPSPSPSRGSRPRSRTRPGRASATAPPRSDRARHPGPLRHFSG